MKKIYRKGFEFRLISHKTFQTHRIINRSSSVSFDSLAPAHLALRANLRLLFLKDPPAFSVVRSVVSSAGLGFNPHALERPPTIPLVSMENLIQTTCVSLRLVERDTDSGRQIQAPSLRQHWNFQTVYRMLPQKRFRQSARLPSKNEIVFITEFLVPINLGRLGCEIKEPPFRYGRLKLIERRPPFHITQVPIVHSSAAKGFCIQRETQRFNKMQPRPGRQTQSGYVASIGWDFRLYKYDMQHLKSMQRCIVSGNWIPARTFHVEHFLKISERRALG